MIERVDPRGYVTLREGESRIGQRISFYAHGETVEQTLFSWKKLGVQLVLLGIPEDIGPRANLGRGGADQAWLAFLERFCNLQWHDAPQYGLTQLAILGSVPVSDLMREARQADTARLRHLVAELDVRVQSVVEPVFRAGMIPVVIGGGHNNALPILRAWHRVQGIPVPVINVDPHTDTRPMEGRHSGNPFHYALHEGILHRYAVMGLNPWKNSAESLGIFRHYHCRAFSEIDEALRWLAPPKQIVGIELDLDAISEMPSSAGSIWGASLDHALSLICHICSQQQPAWLHFCEGAPACHPAGESAGRMKVGDGLCALLYACMTCSR